MFWAVGEHVLSLQFVLLTASACLVRNRDPLPPHRMHECSTWQMSASSQRPGHEPWTHAPYCVGTGNGGRSMCVFTNTEFNSGRGIAIIGQPAIVETLVNEGLLQTAARETGSSSNSTKYIETERPGSGIGLYVKSSQSYKAGEIIMREYPTLIVASGTSDSIQPRVLEILRWKALLQLPAGTRQSIRALAQSHEMHRDEIADILDTNAFTHEKGGAVHDIIFPEAARMNHNCIPNAVTRTNHTTLAMEVVALRDILPGEEIAHSYLDPSVELTFDERAKRLGSGWAFQCQCALCSSGRVKLEKSDKRRKMISRTKASLETAKGDPGKILEHAETLLRLYAEEGMILPKADHYALAAHACMYLGEKKKAIQYSRMAKQLWDVIFGEGSRESESMVEFESKLG
ncbi:hypothetical protein V8F33_012473 [Rhypophila sp. PSN 637]